MLMMTYDREGDPVGDFGVEEVYWMLKDAAPGSRLNKTIYSTANIFHRVRLGVVNGEIGHQQVVFMFRDEDICVNEFGSCLVWPEGFLEQAEYCTQILTAAVSKAKRRRE